LSGLETSAFRHQCRGPLASLFLSGPGPYGELAFGSYSEVQVVDVTAEAFVIAETACIGSLCIEGWGFATPTNGLPGSDTNTFDQSLTLNSNSQYLVEINAYVQLNGSSLLSYGTAAADLSIQIDPAFQANNLGYSLVLSAGVDNATSAAPEPSSLALLGAGLAAIVWLRRTSEGRNRRD
jgi:hypothetical protein